MPVYIDHWMPVTDERPAAQALTARWYEALWDADAEWVTLTTSRPPHPADRLLSFLRRMGERP